MQTEKIELEATVVDESKERESYCGQGNRRFSGKYDIHLCHIFCLELSLKYVLKFFFFFYKKIK